MEHPNELYRNLQNNDINKEDDNKKEKIPFGNLELDSRKIEKDFNVFDIEVKNVHYLVLV